MKKVLSLALVAGMFVFASCETKTAETETTTVEGTEATDATTETTLEGDTTGMTTTTETTTTTDTTAVAPVQ